MPLNFAMSLMSVAEFLLWASLGFIFWKKGLQRRFPAMHAYLLLRVTSMPVLLCLLYLQAQPSHYQTILFPMYFFAYWAVYIASAVMLFFITVEIFRSVLSSFSGLMKLGTIAFRWAALISVIVSMATVSYKHPGVSMIPEVAFGLARSVSILELCLLAFLCVCMNALRLSMRDLSFGVAVGFGLMSVNDFITAALVTSNPSFTAPVQFVSETMILLSIGIWIAYVALPEPVRKPVTIPANSTIYRWNEIAAALGHGTQVAVYQPANGSFLSDVEKVVDKVLTRNMQSEESKSEA